jgi:hypothetical protein
VTEKNRIVYSERIQKLRQHLQCFFVHVANCTWAAQRSRASVTVP